MASRGPDGVAIREITERADVGFGSFYNHFESKDAIYDALVAEVFEGFGAGLDGLRDHVTDPAEVLAASVRYTLRRGQGEPVWGRLLVRIGFSARVLQGGGGYRLLRDLEIGVGAGRFSAPDRLMTFVAVGSIVLGALNAALQHGEAAAAGMKPSGVPERAAAIMLRFLGVPVAEAEAIARRPLPPIEAGPSDLAQS